MSTVQYAPQTPSTGPESGRGEIAALFRADLSNYSHRWSTWLPPVLAVVFGGLLMLSSLDPSRTTDGGGRITANAVSSGLSQLTLVVCGGMAFLAAAAWMGFEHTSGSLGTWLSFNPRRVRVWLSRLTVAVLVPTTLGLLGMLTAGLPVLGDARGLTEWAGRVGPYLTVIATFGALGFAVASIGRHVLWALGAVVGFFALLVLSENLFSGRDRPYLLHDALGDFIEGPKAAYSSLRPVEVLGMAPHVAGGVVWVGFTVVVVAVALLLFRRSSID